MGEGRDKSALLHELIIDRSVDNAEPVAWLPLIAAVFVGLIFGGGVVYFFVGNSAPVDDVASHSLVTTAAVTIPENTLNTEASKPDREEVLNASGYITARRIATVSSEIMGLIVSVDVEEGMAVETGQVLARLDSAIAQVNLALGKAQIDAQQARVTSLQSEVEESDRILKRVSKLEGASFSSEALLTRSQTDLTSMNAALESSRADLKVAQLNVVRLKENLNRHTIRAPFSGVVTVKNAQPGEIVAPAAAGGGFTRTGICTIVDMDSLEIEVDVNESFINRVYPGQNVIANLDAYPDWDIPASVIAVIPTAVRAKATVRVRIKIETKDSKIFPDMGVKVAFIK